MSANEEAMNTTQTGSPPDIEALPDNAAELRGQIEETRQDLGDTVEALAAKVDVKEQAKEKFEAGKEQAKEKFEAGKEQAKEKFEAGKEQLREKGPGKPAMAAAGALLLLIVRRRRKARKARQV